MIPRTASTILHIYIWLKLSECPLFCEGEKLRGAKEGFRGWRAAKEGYRGSRASDWLGVTWSSHPSSVHLTLARLLGTLTPLSQSEVGPLLGPLISKSCDLPKPTRGFPEGPVRSQGGDPKTPHRRGTLTRVDPPNPVSK